MRVRVCYRFINRTVAGKDNLRFVQKCQEDAKEADGKNCAVEYEMVKNKTSLLFMIPSDHFLTFLTISSLTIFFETS